LQPFPLDIYSIKNIGLDTWQENFYWPVSAEEYEKIEDNVHEAFNKIEYNSDNIIKDSLWVLYPRIILCFPLLIHNKLVLDRLSNNNILFDNDYLKKAYVSITNIIWDFLLYNKKIEFPSIESHFYAKMNKRFIKELGCLKNNLLNSYNLLTEPSQINNTRFFAAEPLSEDMIDFAKENQGLISKVNPYRLKKSNNYKYINNVNDVTDVLIKDSLNDYEGLFTKKQINEIKTTISKQINFIINMNEQNTILFEKYRSNSFLAMRLGDLLIRSVSIACMRNGIQSYGFTHGNYIGLFKAKKFSNIFFGCVNNFIAPTKTSKLYFLKSAEQFNNKYNKSVKIKYIKNNTNINKMKINSKNISKPKKIKKVMVIEYGLGFDHQIWPFYLHLTLSIGKVLKNISGLMSVIKLRPERIKESEGVYDKVFDKCIIQPFEEIYDQADILIFPDISSTTFGFSLFTNLPIIIFSHNLKKIFQEAENDLSKRCNVVSSLISPDGKYEFDQSRLQKIVKGNYISSTHDFVNKYYNKDN